MLVQPVQYDLGNRVSLELDDDPKTVSIRLVAEVPDVDELLVAHELGDLLDHPRLVHHERNLGDDDPLTRPVNLLDGRLRPHDHPSAPRAVSLFDPLPPAHISAGRKVRTGHERLELFLWKIRVLDEGLRRGHDLAEVVRWDVRGHADGDTRATVDQEVRHAGGQDGGLLQPVVEVRNEVDGLLVYVAQQLGGEGRQPGLGIPVGGRRIPVDRAEIALAVDQRVAQ